MHFFSESCDVGFLEDRVQHSGLVHVVELFVSVEMDANKLLVGSISDLILVGIEGRDQEVPFVDHVGASKPAEVVTVGDEYHGRTVDPIEVELEVPWSVFITALSDTAIELFRKVLPGWRRSVYVAHGFDDLVARSGIPLVC